MPPFEVVYGRRLGSLVGCFKVGESDPNGHDLFYEFIEKVRLIKERLRMNLCQ